MIYSSEPSDWRDLQNKVGDVLRVCGMKAEVEHTLETVRGKVDVDVYAADETVRPSLTYLCECKHWSTAVPKNVVHGFRTVVNDTGAHVGIIISRSGFQSGAYEAAEKSNVRLVDWFEFQAIFLERWKEGRYGELRQLFEDLFEYYDYFAAPIGNSIGGRKDRLDEWNEILSRYQDQCAANPWGRTIGPTRFPQPLPHRVVEVARSGLTQEFIFEDCASLFDWNERRATEGLAEMRDFVARYRTGPAGG
ncbi:restriction endonuclease [Variovorax fucosicus]|uniref:restriction endonuclease n=1 Tax=Variovorax fucosicus TaxID=3053517 RepID=UPI002575B298|nr:restriction endonuclease [Variovorax sp. J22G47]MDM0055234.1 restriction endonuclease [Variovorax sp. J22G47]